MDVAEVKALAERVRAEVAKAMTDYHDQMARAGVAIIGNGLAPTSAGARVKFTGGKPMTTDGTASRISGAVTTHGVSCGTACSCVS